MTQEYQVGFTKIDVSTQFNYPIDLAIWYPTYAIATAFRYGLYGIGEVAFNATCAKEKFPLLVISCGYAGSVYDQAYLAEHLAKQGFIVASVACPQREKANNLGCGRAWYRANEIKCAIHFMFHDIWQTYVDENSGIGLLGFSAGGFSALLVAGGKPVFEQDATFHDWLPTLAQYDFESLYEPKVRALALLAPALGQVFNKTALKAIISPTLLMLAEQDEILHHTTDIYRHALPNCVETIAYKEAGHFIFNGPVSAILKKIQATKIEAYAKKRNEDFHPDIKQKVGLFFSNYFLTSELRSL